MKEETKVNDNINDNVKESSPCDTEANENLIGQDYEMKHKKENRQIKDSHCVYPSSMENAKIIERNKAVKDDIIEDMNQELLSLTSNDSSEVEYILNNQ